MASSTLIAPGVNPATLPPGAVSGNVTTSGGGTLVKDPTTGAFTLQPGAGSNPLGTGAPSVSELGIGGTGTVGTGTSAGDPYSRFNANIASILAQIQTAANAGRQGLSGAKDALTTEAVGAAGPYNPAATPAVNTQATTGTLNAFAPAVTSISTQLSNADAALKDLETTIGSIQTANQPQTLAPGESLVTKGGTTLKQGHQYTPQINPNTGLLDGFDINTGTWASADTGSGGGGSTGGGTTTSSASGSDSVSSAIDSIFGSSNPIGAYAADPNYVSEISGLYKTVAGLGVTQSPDTLQQYITNNAKGSPVTGQMILNASSTYGIDPALLTTVLLHESDFGTAGVATKTNNPGNIGNTGTSTQQYPSWQQGVMAAAKNLASRISAAGSSGAVASSDPSFGAGAATATPNATPTDTTSPVGASFSPDATQKISQLPAAYQSYVDAGPLGVAYINNDRVPTNIQQGLQTMASRAGIPYVQAADVGALKSIQTVLSNLDSMQTLANNTLGSGTLGHLFGETIGRAEQGLQTKNGIQLGLFDNYRDVAIKAVQALAGGAGSGLRINMGEISANTQNLPQATDSKENAIAQIKQLKQLIYTQLATTFPYAQVQVTDPNGQSGTLPAGKLSSALQAGYSIQ